MSTIRVPHAIRRAEELFGLKLSFSHLNEIKRLCTPENLYMRRGQGVVHVVVWQGIEMLPVIISTERGREVATFFEPDSFKPNRHKERHRALHKASKARRRRSYELEDAE